MHDCWLHRPGSFEGSSASAVAPSSTSMAPPYRAELPSGTTDDDGLTTMHGLHEDRPTRDVVTLTQLLFTGPSMAVVVVI